MHLDKLWQTSEVSMSIHNLGVHSIVNAGLKVLFRGYLLQDERAPHVQLGAAIIDSMKVDGQDQQCRRPHRKSRAGCLRCKTRKVKVSATPAVDSL